MTYSKEYIDRAEEVILHTYNRFQIVLDKGNGVHLYDVDGKEYLDFAAGIAVFALGYNNQAYNQALKDQIDKVIHTSNLYYNVPMMEAAEKLVKATGLSKVFFTNSGTEAIEGAIKVARKYAYLKDGSNDHEIIAMNHSFHGRSLGALSVTGNTHYQDPFKPLIGGIKFADFNDLESVKAQITDKTCAIIMETVQGEGGIYPAEPEAASRTDGMDRIELIEAYREIIKENIEYDLLILRYGRERLDEALELMLEVILSKRPYIRIAGDDFPREIVKSRFLKINSGHLEYVFDCIDKNTTKVGNIKAYLLAALYNAPTTINSYYSSLVQHDMYGDGQRGRG